MDRLAPRIGRLIGRSIGRSIDWIQPPLCLGCRRTSHRGIDRFKASFGGTPVVEYNGTLARTWRGNLARCFFSPPAPPQPSDASSIESFDDAARDPG